MNIIDNTYIEHSGTQPFLGHCNNIRCYAVRLKAPVVGAASAETGLYLVRNAHPTSLTYHLVRPRQIPCRVLICPADAL